LGGGYVRDLRRRGQRRASPTPDPGSDKCQVSLPSEYWQHAPALHRAASDSRAGGHRGPVNFRRLWRYLLASERAIRVAEGWWSLLLAQANAT
jgi:hypothetical protein